MERLYGVRNGSANEKGNNRIGEPNNSVDQKSQSDIAAQMGISVDTLQNYKMLSEMIPELEELLDTGIVKKSIKNLFLLPYTYATIYVGTVGRYDIREVLHMKKVTLEATDENVLQSIQDKIGNRNACVLEFIETLDSIEDNRFISLDAKWGAGKTFYVRQIEKTLEFQMLRKCNPEDARYKEMVKFFDKTEVQEIELEHTYLPIYYNAWLYDNHTDPLLSLLFVISKKCGDINTQLSESIPSKLKEVLSSVSLSIPLLSLSGEKLLEAVEEKDILKEIQLAEDVRENVKRIFDEVIVEKVDKLVIFIDELDRCRPSYALEMLERIKHYFDDDRIIFLVSVNKEQLTHTISNYYGNGFDSTGYLNKFFDLEARFPELQTYDNEIDTGNREQYFLQSISNMLVKYYRLTRRDFLIYRDKINNLSSYNRFNDFSLEGTCLSLFVPILILFDMRSTVDKEKFLNGDSKILEIIKMLPEGRYLYESFALPGCEENEKIENGYDRFKKVYDFVFGNSDKEQLRSMRIELNLNFKQEVLRYCGQI